MNNPFSLTFGKEPTQMIARYSKNTEIISTFLSETPNQQVYMITGVRGSGKTVFMSSLANQMRNRDDWVVVELNSSGELLKELVAKLYNTKGLSRVFEAEGINLSFWGIGVNIKRAEPITDLETAAERMMQKLQKNGKKLLITIDEVTNTKEMKYFAGSYQIFIRHNLPVFLLMTGLYENINKLQNEDNLTFLYRAPKIYLEALSIFRIADSYEAVLNFSHDEAVELSKMTKGYPFAYQVIGYFAFEFRCDLKKALPEARQYLDEYVYDKVWSELSAKEVEILSAMAESEIKDVNGIKQHLNLKPNEFSVYRDRLIKKGIVEGSRRGWLEFTLPFFDEYIKEHTLS